MDWKRVIDNNITHASSTVENRYQQSFISLLSTSMFSLGTFKYCVVTFMKYFCCIKQKFFFLYKILVKEHFVVGWFDALSDEILACSKYDFLGLEFGIRI